MTALLAYLFSPVSSILSSRQMTSRHSKYHLPIPRDCHVVLDEATIRNRSIFIIGDVHGCKDELVEILQMAALEEPGKEILPIFVGDLLNKGPLSMETMKFLRTLDHFAVRGNHEEAVLNQLLKLGSDPNYKLPEKYAWITELTENDIEYHMNLPYTITIPSVNAIIVHAGLVPGVPLDQQDFKNMISMRNLVPREDGAGYIGRESRDKGEPWASLWAGPEHVYFGHDAVRLFQDYPFATGLDTGCLYGFKLSGMFLNGCKRKLEVNAKKVYRPP